VKCIEETLEVLMAKKIKKPARLNIKSPEACRLARKLAKLTGESITVAVRQSLLERLEILRGGKKKNGLPK
jgi:hypothetical protein